MTRAADEDTLRSLGQEMQRIVVDEVPFSPLYNSYWFVDVNATYWTGWPTPDDFDAVPFPSLGPDTVRTLLSLKPAS